MAVLLAEEMKMKYQPIVVVVSPLKSLIADQIRGSDVNQFTSRENITCGMTLAHARWKSRRLLAVVSLSFGVGETNCSQGTVLK